MLVFKVLFCILEKRVLFLNKCIFTYLISLFKMCLLPSVLFFKEGPRSRSYGRIAALRLIVQPCDED
jgi:hypothetical protein